MKKYILLSVVILSFCFLTVSCSFGLSLFPKLNNAPKVNTSQDFGGTTISEKRNFVSGVYSTIQRSLNYTINNAVSMARQNIGEEYKYQNSSESVSILAYADNYSSYEYIVQLKNYTASSRYTVWGNLERSSNGNIYADCIVKDTSGNVFSIKVEMYGYTTEYSLNGINLNNYN